MRKDILALLLVALIGTFATNCTSIEEGDTNYTYIPPCDNEPCDGDTTLAITQMNIVLLADESVGREATITFYRMFDNDANEMVLNFPITIQNGAIHGFAGPAGNYWVSVNGLAVTSYAEFTLTEGEVGTMVLEMYEFPLITWYASLNAASPGGQTVPQLGQEVMRFNLWHIWTEPLQLRLINFSVMYTLNLEVTACSLYEMEQATGDWTMIGIAGVENYNVQFNADSGTLDSSLVPPTNLSTYSLRCDVWGYNPNNDVLQAELNGLVSYPEHIEQDVQTLPIYGNLHAY